MTDDAINKIEELKAQNAQLTAKLATARAALEAWEHWYNVDSTECNREMARGAGLKVLAELGAKTADVQPSDAEAMAEVQR